MDAAYEEFVAYTFLEGADRSKYGEVMKTLDGQYSFKNDQYPKNLEDAITALKAHKFDNKYHEEKKKKKEKEKEGKPQEFEPLELSFANLKNRCYICGKYGHHSMNCRLKDKIPRDNWAANKAAKNDFKKAQSHAQQGSAVAQADPLIAQAVAVDKTTDLKENDTGWC